MWCPVRSSSRLWQKHPERTPFIIVTIHEQYGRVGSRDHWLICVRFAGIGGQYEGKAVLIDGGARFRGKYAYFHQDTSEQGYVRGGVGDRGWL
jgi:hypothetical protein